MATISSLGVGSNLDINSLLSQLMAVEQQPLQALNQREAKFQARLSAYGNVKSVLAGFQTALSALTSPAKLQAVKASSSDTAVATATAATGAVAGSYNLEVSSLASAQRLVAAGQASSASTIGVGTLSFDFGAISGGSFDSNTGRYTGASFTTAGGVVKTVEIGAADASLTGIRDAINRAKIGVTAAIVNDGAASPYRLVLAADNSGAKNSLKLSVTGDAALATLLAHDPAATQNLSETVTARNAAFKVNGVAISQASNNVSDAIAGVNLKLLKTTSSQPVTITVERDVAAVRSNIELFVKAFNDVNKLLGDISAANVQTGQNGILQGDAAVRGIQTALRRTLGTELNGAGALRNLTQIGVTFGKDGKLAIDAAKLDRALQDNFDDVAQLFAATGRASDPLVSYSSAGDKTQAGQYVLQISQLATRGWAVGAQAAGLTINSGNNDTLNFTIDGVAGTLALAAGTYASADALAAEVQSKLNGVAGLVAANVAVTVSAAAGVLTVQSNRYGSASSVNFTGGNGLTNLLGVPVATAGLDVAGSIGGVTASGSGQSLLAAGGAAEGLKVSITGGALGGRGTIDYSQGFAFRLDKLAAAFISSSGVLAARTDGLSRSIDTIEGRRRQMEQRLSEIEERYRQQFTSLDKLVSQLNSTSAFLNQQLARLPTISQE